MGYRRAAVRDDPFRRADSAPSPGFASGALNYYAVRAPFISPFPPRRSGPPRAWIRLLVGRNLIKDVAAANKRLRPARGGGAIRFFRDRNAPSPRVLNFPRAPPPPGSFFFFPSYRGNKTLRILPLNFLIGSAGIKAFLPAGRNKFQRPADRDRHK